MANAAADDKTESGSTSAGAASSGGGKLVMILTLVNLLATIGMIAILFISFQRDRKKPAIEDISTQEHAAAPEEKEGEGAKGEDGKPKGPSKNANMAKMVTLEQFTVNLATPGSVSPKFVRVNISLEVPNEDAETEVGTKVPQVRNTIIDLFNSKRPADLATAEGRDYLKEEIRNALNGFLVVGKVKGVYFTNFALSS